MIVEALINLITGIIKVIALPFSILPDTPQSLVDSMDYYLDLVFNNISFVGFFVNVNTLKAVALIAIAIWTLDKTYSLLIWIIHKLPIGIN